MLRLLRKEDGDAPALWSATLLQMGIAIYMLYLSQAFVIIRQRSLLPAFFYLLLTGTNPALFFDPIGSIAAFGVTFCLFFLFSTYQNSQSQKEILNIALLIGLISLLWFPVLFLLPLFWYGMYRFKSLNFRTFFAGFAGILIVYLSLFCWSLYKEDLSIFFDKIPDLSSLWSFQSFGFTLKNWLMMGMLFFLLILSGINIFMAGISEKIRTIITLRYLYLFAFIIIILFLLNINWGSEWTLILYIPFSYLFAHYFTLATQKWSSWLFLFTIVFFIGMYFILDSW
ncbi:MAG: hypothetical protein LIO93_06100 [Bacteroidales bacterium]|nr:hypothetical protein [Bacteroidales bacterium]